MCMIGIPASLRTVRFPLSVSFPQFTSTEAHFCKPHSKPISLNVDLIVVLLTAALFLHLWYGLRSST